MRPDYTRVCLNCGDELSDDQIESSWCFCSLRCAAIVYEDHLWRRVDRSGGEDACWPHADTNNKGYGQIRIRVGHVKPKSYRAHRIAYLLVHGELPEGKVVRHTCDNPPCCNPRHLVIGTQLDNVRDMWERGRDVHVGARGENCHFSKLTEEMVREARLLYQPRSHEFGTTALARRYGVDHTVIRRAIVGETWKHVK